ncbi:MAG: replicative DNA helicase [Candidatus Omnitrophica bacterium]|nr:replicative DNA helicase [Candidatus Omnitrophota bacterium]
MKKRAQNTKQKEPTVSALRTNPNNIEAEMALLGSMIIDEDALHAGMEVTKEEYFYKEIHRKIFRSLVNLYSHSNAIDLVTLADELKRQKVIEDIGGAAYLTELTNAVPSTTNVSHYARIVKEKNVLRSLITNATRIISSAYEAENKVDEVLDHAEQLIFDISDSRIESSNLPLKEVIKNSIETIDRLYQRKAHVTGLPTGYSDFDVRTAGLQASDFIVIAGRPSMGKSSFALGITEHLGLVEKIPVAFFSLEMSKEQLAQRMICSHARVDAHRVRTGFLSASDWPRLTQAAGKLSDAKIFVDDTASLSIFELRAKARRLKSQHNIQLIVVDYLQLMRGPSNAESKQQEISEISRSLKALARELRIPLIAISQLSRAVESRTDRRPQLSDLRESGAIEQDADLVTLLLREEYYNPTEDNKGIADVIIAKQRNGPVGSMKLTFIKEYTRFEDIAPSHI